jgi:DNA-binding transcriptional LysR family regulator
MREVPTRFRFEQHSLFVGWREKHPEVVLTVAEMNESEIQTAMQERRVDVALMTSHTLRPDAVTAPLYRERVVAAIPREIAEGNLPRSGLGQQSVRARVLCVVHGQWRQVLHSRGGQAVRVRIGWSRIRNHSRDEEPVRGRVPGRRVSADPGGERVGVAPEFSRPPTKDDISQGNASDSPLQESGFESRKI